MNKLLLCVFGLMVLLATACRKDSRIMKTYLLSQVVIDDRADGAPLDTTRYFYDNQNHMILIKTGIAGNYGSFTMSYDATGRVAIAKKLNANGSIAKEYDFFYTPSTGFILSAPSQKSDTAYFIFNDKKQTTTIQTLHGGHSAYTYDDRGNISTLKNYYANGSNDLSDENYYTYDAQKSYFSQTASDNYFLMYLLFPDASTLINNAVTKNADTYVYTYNSDGFPVKAMATIVGHTVTPIYYNYLTK